MKSPSSALSMELRVFRNSSRLSSTELSVITQCISVETTLATYRSRWMRGSGSCQMTSHHS